MPDDSPLPRLGTPEYFADPYRTLSALRERAPVDWDSGLGRWIVTGRPAVRAILADPDTYSSCVIPRLPERDRTPELGAFTRLSERWLFFQDPPGHTRQRSALQPAFSPRAVEKLRPEILRDAESLLDGLPGSADLVAGYAHPLAAGTIARLLCPSPEEQHNFLQRCRHLADGSEAPRDPDVRRRGLAAMAWLARYVEAAAGPDTIRTRLMDWLVAECGPEAAAAHALVLVFAGIETTQNCITAAVLSLLRARLWGSVAEDPSQIPSLLEECLRAAPPVLGVVRRARKAAVLEGCRIAPGQELLVMTAAADRDSDLFPDPESIYPNRGRCPHLAFGHGIHYCLGAALARLEARVAVEALSRRFPALRLGSETLEWYDHDPIVRGLKRLPVALR